MNEPVTVTHIQDYHSTGSETEILNSNWHLAEQKTAFA